MKIIPAILPKRYYQITNAVEDVFGAANTIQIDIVDGFFANNKTWPLNGKDEEVLEQFEREEMGLPHWDEMNYELDLMIKDPLKHIDQIMMLGPSKIIFHLESFQNEDMLQYFETLPEIVRTTVEFGIAIGIGTPPEDITPFAQYITTVQCMGIADIGFQGQTFDVRAIAQIKRTKELYPDKTVSVDGGMNHASIPLVVAAGADALVVGSAIFGSANPRVTIQELKRLCKTAATASEI